MEQSKLNDLEKLLSVMKRLRGPEGCPWDKEQTLDSLKWYLVEECFEVLDAIENGSPEKLMEELGDTLFQIVFLAEISEEEENFNIFDVINSAREKMIRRHPHVFDNQKAYDSNEVKKIWWQIKEEEKGGNEVSVLDSIPNNLPSLLRAFRISKRASHAGFDYDNIDGVLNKLEERIEEFKVTLNDKEKERMEDELGDILFSLVNLCRFLDINPEDVLRKTTNKFTTRFKEMERSLINKGMKQEETTPEDLKKLWNRTKRHEF